MKQSLIKYCEYSQLHHKYRLRHAVFCSCFKTQGYSMEYLTHLHYIVFIVGLISKMPIKILTHSTDLEPVS